MGLREFKDTPVPSPCRSHSQTYFTFILVPISPPSPRSASWQSPQNLKESQALSRSQHTKHTVSGHARQDGGALLTCSLARS